MEQLVLRLNAVWAVNAKLPTNKTNLITGELSSAKPTEPATINPESKGTNLPVEESATETVSAFPPAVANIPVASLNLSTRCKNVLRSIKINTIGDLLTQCSEPMLMGLRNFGRTSLLELKSELHRLGLKLNEL